MRLKPIGLALAAALLFGLSTPAAKALLEGAEPWAWRVAPPPRRPSC